jgi:1,4-dihydroxy-2-naphthoyl-CoA hydrolase
LDLRTRTTLVELNRWTENNLMAYLGIHFTEIGPDYICAEMLVTPRHHQTFGILHGGASVTLAESVGSIAANMAVDRTQFACVGLEINANHLRPVREGIVTATARPIHLGQTTQVWEILLRDGNGKFTCACRHTLAVRPKEGHVQPQAN